jgi:hypothetical protein
MVSGVNGRHGRGAQLPVEPEGNADTEHVTTLHPITVDNHVWVTGSTKHRAPVEVHALVCYFLSIYE